MQYMRQNKKRTSRTVEWIFQEFGFNEKSWKNLIKNLKWRSISNFIKKIKMFYRAKEMRIEMVSWRVSSTSPFKFIQLWMRKKNLLYGTEKRAKFNFLLSLHMPPYSFFSRSLMLSTISSSPLHSARFLISLL